MLRRGASRAVWGRSSRRLWCGRALGEMLREKRRDGAAELRKLRGKHKAGDNSRDEEQRAARQSAQERGGKRKKALIELRAEEGTALKDTVQSGTGAFAQTIRQTAGKGIKLCAELCKQVGEGGEQRRKLVEECG